MKKYCPKHPTSFINEKYGKCWNCAKADGDLVLCKKCEVKYHAPKFESCYDCSDFSKNFK